MLSHTQLSSSSTSHAKLCSKTYKKASQLYLTRRLPESLAAVQPFISISKSSDDQESNGDQTSALAPIATAPSTWRIKLWNLYGTLLSAIVQLGVEEGAAQFGQKEWKSIATRVREGAVWEEVVQIGYRGREGSVDAEVVFNLATLLLTHASSQALNQQRLETYLSSYGQPHLDLVGRLEDSTNDFPQKRISATNGADTPKDLTARVRIIELFTLHVLPSNGEWEYAQEFINLSEVLDEERKELFIQTLEQLKEEKERGELRAAELQRNKDAEFERQQDEERRRAEEEAAKAAAQQSNNHKHNTPEVDFGIEKGSPRSTSKAKGSKVPDKSLSGKPTARAAVSPKSSKKQVKAELRADQPRAIASLRNLIKNIIQSISANPISLLRALLFVIGILMAVSRQNVRERVRRITGTAWQKMKDTVGMGVKVSYI
ncbi:hypothetical protein N7495_006423 [Penicillium taxi]|uniref:uncharacterized protein n=1 Tax=Penicillium taxi TaxID=168475 RepID=UPI0025459DF5|nr:uncharacterized protein N7495_006423 [Penicillium taxi]KAJ5894732.1 hypothetical protein N7495_006423 [Penicillium taxi]